MKITVLDGYTENPGDLSWGWLEALGETIWRAQRDKAPLDALAYVEAVRRKAAG